MARRRMIDPNFFESEDVSRLSLQQRYLLLGMVSMADDYGKGRANPAKIRSFVFPYEDIPISKISDDLKAIGQHISVIFYEIDGNSYFMFKNWCKWQRVDKPQPSNIPDPSNDSKNDSKNDSRLKEKNIKEDNIEEKNSNPLTPLKGGTLQVISKKSDDLDWNEKLLNIFLDVYEKSRGNPFAVSTRKGKETMAMNEIFQKYLKIKKAQGFNPTTEESLSDIKTFCEKAMQITEDFIYTKMSPSLLASQFNSIYSIIKEKQFGKDRSSVTTDDILNIASSTINSN